MFKRHDPIRLSMRSLFVILATVLTTAIAAATDLTPKDLVAQLYQAPRSSHDPFVETQLLGRYFDAPLLKLYLRDKREAKGEVGRLDRDPLYNAQDIQIANFSISLRETARGETRKNSTRQRCAGILRRDSVKALRNAHP